MWHDLYESHRLPELSDAWAIETDEEKPTWHYVLDVDQEPFLLEEYDDANAMIQASLEGLKSNRYRANQRSYPRFHWTILFHIQGQAVHTI